MNACINPDFVKVVYFILLIIEIIVIIVPIGLIIMSSIDFSKSVINGDEQTQKKNLNLFIKRVITAILIFAVPWLVKITIVSLGNLTEDVNFTDCIENANPDKIAELEDNAKGIYCYLCGNSQGATYLWGNYSRASRDCKIQPQYNEEECLAKKEKLESANNHDEDKDEDSNQEQSSNTKQDQPSSTKDHIILVGDSRTVHIFNNLYPSYTNSCKHDDDKNSTLGTCYIGCDFGDGITGIAKSGRGILWANGTSGEPKPKEVNDAINNALKEYPNSYIGVFLGVNDCGGFPEKWPNLGDLYYEWLSDISNNKNAKVVFISTTYVDDTKISSVQNAHIEAFNATMKDKLSNSNISYCDIYSEVKKDVKIKSDGLHYEKESAQNLFNHIKKCFK